jgi:hypothetical protein
MHMGPVFRVRSLVRSSVASVSGDSPACDLALVAHPFVEEGSVGGASGAHLLTIATGCFAPIPDSCTATNSPYSLPRCRG